MDDSENGCKRKRAEHKDHVWSYDFVIDRAEDGRRLKMMQNPYSETFISRLGDELLKREVSPAFAGSEGPGRGQQKLL